MFLDSGAGLFRPPCQLRAEEAGNLPFQLGQTNPGLHGRFALALGWFGDYDGYDLAALSLLAHGPAVSLPMIRPVLSPRRAQGDSGGFSHGSHMAWQGAVH
jgi:hypothetical protein